MNIAIITGASAGLGKEFFRSVCTRYPDMEEIWLIARRQEKLEELARDFPKMKCVCISLDLTLDTSYTVLQEMLTEKKPTVKILINNAGLGSLGNVLDSEYESQIRQVDLNNRALTAITCIVLKYMQKSSFVINVCSIAGFCPNPRMTVYCSTKAYVYSYSKSLRFELKPHGINVMAVCPGPMRTEFLGVAGITNNNSKTFATLPYSNPAKVADTAVVKAASGRGIYTPRLFFKFYRVLSKLLPHGLLMHMSKA